MKVPHYTEIKVRRWRLLPKVRLGFLFDMYAWFLLFDEFGVELADLQKESAKRIVYAAAVSAARAEGRKVWVTPEQIEVCIEQSTTKESGELVKTLRDSQTVIDDFNKKINKGSKKK